jgi:hypothetical protein
MPPTQVFVRVLDGSTRCLAFERDAEDVNADGVTLGDLRRRLEQLEGIPSDQQLLTCGSKVLGAGTANDSFPLADEASYTLLLKLCGGKGGFGALLRASGDAAGTTTNFDACRDLSGRGGVEHHLSRFWSFTFLVIHILVYYLLSKQNNSWCGSRCGPSDRSDTPRE